MGDQASEGGTFAPFKNRLFLAFWIASVVSNFGALIQAVGAAWMMTSMSKSTILVTLVTVMTVLPLVLFSIPAGAVADLGDRRKTMLFAQSSMLIVSAALAATTWVGIATPSLLLLITFLLGCGTALNGPSGQASVNEIVGRQGLAGAVTLNGLGFNLARAAGPAIGGAVVASYGPQATFALNALTYVGMIVVLVTWRRQVPRRALPRESFGEAMATGVRYALLSPEIRTALIRALPFGVFASAMTALMPLIARDRLKGSALTYGLLLAIFGAGSVLGALASGRLRTRFSNEAIMRGLSVVLGAVTVAVSMSTSLVLTAPTLIIAGGAWVLGLSMFNTIVQLAAPGWVIGRAMATIQMTMFAGFAIGGLASGVLAQAWGISITLIVAGVGLEANALLGVWLPIATPDADGSTSPGHKRALDPRDIDPRSGPVVTTVQYCIAKDQASAFLCQIWELRAIRRRNGARQWAILNDVDDPEIWIERFESTTWLDHLRQTERPTNLEIDVAKRVFRFHSGEKPPTVQHALERSPGSFGEKQAQWLLQEAHGSLVDQ